MAKYKMHKINKKEAKKLLKTFGSVNGVNYKEDCYCLVDKKGRVPIINGAVCIVAGTLEGRDDVEKSFKRAMQAYSYFKYYAKEADFSFKKPKMSDLLAGNFTDNKLKLPNDFSYSVEVAILENNVNLGQDIVSFLSEVSAMFDTVNELRHDIPNFCDYMPTTQICYDYEEDGYDEYEDEEDYPDDDFDDEYEEDENEYDEELDDV